MLYNNVYIIMRIPADGVHMKTKVGRTSEDVYIVVG